MMYQVGTIRECFKHNDWARDQVLALTEKLSDEQLERPFAMGPGSLRQTLRHLYGAGRFWFERWRGREQTPFPHSRDLSTVDELWAAERALADARDALLGALHDNDLGTRVAARGEGEGGFLPLGIVLLHICNHGIHHRAQALNMLRHLGVKVPGLDYLFMRAAHPTVAFEPVMRERLAAIGFQLGEELSPPGRLDVETLRTYFRYCDWAQEQILALAGQLGDDELDQAFEIGLGNLRATLSHIRDAEHWWCETWINGPQPDSDKLPASTSITELRVLYGESAERRDAYLGGLTEDAELQRVVGACVRPEIRLDFRLGESMLQLCGHGTHHRAQALNMLRRLGAEVPDLDLSTWMHGVQRGGDVACC